MSSDLSHYKLSVLLNDVLGHGTIKNDESIHFCPFCHHYKPKLQVNLTTQKYHCWVCEKRGHNIQSLFKSLKVSREHLNRLNALCPQGYKPSVKKSIFDPFGTANVSDESVLSLPKEYYPLWSLKKKSILRNHALFYLKKRGITREDIIKHNIGFCESGEFANRIILPSYDSNAQLNFFTGRAIFEEEFSAYKNPSYSKDMVGFELFVNWKEPIVICEGPLDAISVKINAVPLYGKTISSILSLRLVEHQVPTIYLALDNDALSTSLKFAKKMAGYGIQVFIPKFNEKDPNKLGFKKTWEILDRTKKLDLSEFISLRFQE